MQLMARSGPRAVNVVPAYWDTAGSGRFFTRWSAVASLPVSTLLLVPVVQGTRDGYVQGIAAALLSWVVLALPVLVVAGAERRMRDHRSRAILVAVTLLVVAIVRPILNETFVHVLFGGRSGGVWAARIGTNIIVAFGLFTLVAIITTQYQQTRATADRLAHALGRLEAATGQVVTDDRDARLVIRGIVAELRAERDAMLARDVDFDAVRDFSERVRAASHRLEEMAAGSAPVPALWAPLSRTARRRHGLERLQPTPLLWVGALYLLMSAPYLLTVGDVFDVVIAGVAIFLLDLAAGAVLRALPGDVRRGRGAIFLLVWMLAGMTAAVVGRLLLPDTGALMIIPVFAMPLAAIVLSLAIDTYRWARTDEVDATRELARAAVDFADRVRRAQAPLHHAASTLHGRVQGRCVIFAARVDEHAPTADDIAQFRLETDRALDEVLIPAGTSEIDTVGALRRMLAGWEPIMALETRIDDAAASAVDGADAAPIVSEVVNEALVNAVKHSGARAARIDISTDAGGDLHVRVASAGELPRAVMPIRPFAGRTLLYQDGAEVVLESTLPATLIAAHA
ncbi:hypothetical protein HMPREF1529_00460 [Microbacterium sp. oral taxon 186 str. F0373]|nr:hypothetical protein HMPREF1529_00460 [Microbacterium sp. oral taxon 186 str. F0373]